MVTERSTPRRVEPAGRRHVGRWIREDPGLALGTGVILLITLLGYFYPLPYSPIRPDSGAILMPPSGEHWFGTTALGYDVFSRTIFAARQDIPLAAAGTLLSLLIGVPLGLVAGSKGRSAEYVMRALDAFQSFPLVILAITIVTLMGNRLSNVVIAIAIINVPRFMRLIRSEALTVREMRFMEAAIAVGAGRVRLMRRHLLPNVTTPILVQTSLTGANALMVIATLNFLGIGVSPPNPTWGQMIQEGARHITGGAWWLVAFPGLAIIIVVASLNRIAHGLHLWIDDRRRR